MLPDDVDVVRLDSLPILHQVLQDEKLTTNIGWDLVHLLVPLLPQSSQCLQDIARLGNPREVILKVTESLRLIDYEALDEPDEDEEDAEAGASLHPHKTAPTAQGKDSAGSTQATPATQPTYLKPLFLSWGIGLTNFVFAFP